MADAGDATEVGYRAAGVDIDAGAEAVRRIGPLVRSTYRPGVMGDIGGFGGLFDLARSGYRDPILVSATDGVGTKAEIARLTGRLDTIGRDLVAMCVDDLVCSGAAPLFFLDYLAVGRLDPEAVEQLVTGIAAGCSEAGCALIGGEMAEHPGVMAADQFDLVGFAVGAVEREDVMDGSAAAPGDLLVAYSDGITEAENQAGRPFDEDGLERAVHTHVSSPAPDLARTLFTVVEQYAGNVKLADDLTVVVMKRTDAEPPPLPPNAS